MSIRRLFLLNCKFQRMMVLSIVVTTTKAREGAKIRIFQEDPDEEDVLKEEKVEEDLIKGTSNPIIAISMEFWERV